MDVASKKKQLSPMCILVLALCVVIQYVCVNGEDCKLPETPKHGGMWTYVANVGTTYAGALFSCKPGARMVGQSLILCLGTGVWNYDPPKCIYPCEFPEIHGKFGTYIKKYNFQTGNDENIFQPIEGRPSLKYWEKAILRCDEGYQANGGTEMHVECKTEIEPTPTCTPARCTDNPPDVPHAKKRYSFRKTHLTRVSYHCAKGYNKDSSGGDNVTCQYGNWTGVPPVCRANSCEQNPPAVTNAQQRYQDRQHGARVTYICDEGFHQDPLHYEVSCQNGQWKGHLPTCRQVFCEHDPPEVTNAHPRYQDRQHGARVTYICDEGFVIDPLHYEVSCQNGQWKGHLPTCRQVFCEHDPPAVTNAHARYQDKQHGARVTYVCDEGFVMDPIHYEVSCQSGQWEGHLPICHQEYKRCPELELPDGVFVRYIPNREPGGIAVFQCRDKLILIESEQINCLPTGEWSAPPPTCKVPPLEYKECPELVLSDEVFVEYIPKKQPGAVAIFQCRPKLYLTGPSHIYCLPTGEWSSPPPTCKTACITPQLWLDGGLKSLVSEPHFPSVFQVVCEDGYIPNVTFEICFQGIFHNMKSLPCVLENKECPEIASTSHLFVNYVPNRRPGGSAVFLCSNQTVLDGPHSINCLETGMWSDSPPVCKAREEDKQCPKIEPSPGLIVSYTGTRHIGQTVVFTCSEEMGNQRPTRAICLSSGIWSSDPPHCTTGEEVTQCPEFEPSPGLIVRYSGARRVGQRALFRCSEMEFQGFSRAICLPSGEWSSSPPLCTTREEVTDCPEIDASDGLIVRYSGTRYAGQQALFGCSAEMELQGPTRVTCLPSGEWSSSPPHCTTGEEVIQCPDIEPSPGLIVRYSGTRYIGQVALFRCSEGMEFHRPTRSICLPSGEWSSSPPLCTTREEFTQCPDIEPSMGLIVIYSQTRHFGRAALFKCPEEMDLQGPTRVICLPSGEWSSSPPHCTTREEVTECPEIEASEGLIVRYSGTRKVGQAALFECSAEVELQGPTRSICLPSGEWSSSPPLCTSINGCRPVKKAPGSSLIVEPEKLHYQFGETVNFDCPWGTQLTSHIVRVICLGNSWSADAPDCA